MKRNHPLCLPYGRYILAGLFALMVTGEVCAKKYEFGIKRKKNREPATLTESTGIAWWGVEFGYFPLSAKVSYSSTPSTGTGVFGALTYEKKISDLFRYRAKVHYLYGSLTQNMPTLSVLDAGTAQTYTQTNHFVGTGLVGSIESPENLDLEFLKVYGLFDLGVEAFYPIAGTQKNPDGSTQSIVQKDLLLFVLGGPRLLVPIYGTLQGAAQFYGFYNLFSSSDAQLYGFRFQVAVQMSL